MSDYEKDAKKVFQKWIRKRDQGKECISCGSNCSNGHASHFFSAGQYSGLIFEQMNCHLSCVQCNTFLHGNLLEYRKGLIKRYGIEYVEGLESMAQEKRNYKYSREELISIAKKYKDLLK